MIKSIFKFYNKLKYIKNCIFCFVISFYSINSIVNNLAKKMNGKQKISNIIFKSG